MSCLPKGGSESNHHEIYIPVSEALILAVTGVPNDSCGMRDKVAESFGGRCPTQRRQCPKQPNRKVGHSHHAQRDPLPYRQ